MSPAAAAPPLDLAVAEINYLESINNNNNISNNNNKEAAAAALSPSYVNQFRISACCDRLTFHLRVAPNNDPVEFFNLCLSLARGIDYAVANKEVPSRVRELPFLLKQVCKLKHDSILQASILVLMISIKNACRGGWFSDEQSTELCILADEILSCFCSTMDFKTEPSSFQATISTIMSRYYPRIKMGETLAFLEVKLGYGTYVHDFQITKDVKSSHGERIRFLVAQVDNIETSSCLISPTQGNFLLNGKGVERRCNNFIDTGPQMPTLVNRFLKYGTNLLQAVGQFDGNYIIVIAFMSMSSTLDHSTIQDYVQPAISMIDLDSEVIEGPSRISLNCPISFKRMNLPVKGHMCKHRQCFDYHNYMEINSRRPSWRCPHCNQRVCFTDLRIDQSVVKVLKEIDETVSDVMITSDGSWKAILESDDQCDKNKDESSISLPTEIVQLEDPDDTMDLTVDDYDMDSLEISGVQDRKVSFVNAQNDSNVQNMSENDSNMQNMAENFPLSNTNQSTTAPIEDDFWSGVFLSDIGVSEPSFHNLASPVLTDASTPVPNRQVGPFRGNSQVVTSLSHDEICASNSLPLQHSQLGNSALNNEYGHISSIPRHISRTPVAVQALPVPSPTSSHQQRPRNPLMIENSPSIAQTSAVPLIGENIFSVHDNSPRQQNFPGVHQNLQRTQMASSRMQQYPNPQAPGRQSPSQVQNSYRVTSDSQQPMNMTSSMNQSAVAMRPSATSSPPQLYQGGPPTSGIVGSQQARLLAAQRASMMERPVNTSRAPSQYPMNTNELRTGIGSQRESPLSQPSFGNVPMDVTPEQNWRPTGRMRGSLSGRAYSDAVNQYIIRPTQQPQAAAPISMVNAQNYSAFQRDLLIANRAALNEAMNYPYTGSPSTPNAWSNWPSRPN